MFLPAHQRINIPMILGDVYTMTKGTERTPDILAFDNDSSVDVTIHLDADMKGLGTYTPDIVTAFVVKAGGFHTVPNPNPAAGAIKIRGSATVAVPIDLTMLYKSGGVQG